MGRVAQLSEPPTKAAWVVEPEPMMEVSLGREKAQDAFVQTKEKQNEVVGLGVEAEVQARSNEKSKPSAPTFGRMQSDGQGRVQGQLWYEPVSWAEVDVNGGMEYLDSQLVNK
ncbi:hypothetical protein D8674_002015 [Pyrus ussuriensis x Pyrus communis]|uniref:Uncharacterized protein n=1 Tax=Pyrus ussuriensis x Pyrus communis TaxID=2448454 RepID=A0A5N5FIE4_9ROSA|nr:hypothetical protein D8674_002015 [Pyrus ussuriensis x Pyrus communis]